MRSYSEEKFECLCFSALKKCFPLQIKDLQIQFSEKWLAKRQLVKKLSLRTDTRQKISLFCLVMNARNGKSIWKIPKWLSLRSLALKSKFVRQFELSENLEYIYGNSCWRARPCSPATFSIQIKSSLFF